MKTRNISTSSDLTRVLVTSDLTEAKSIWAMLVSAFVYRCAAVVVLGSTLALNAAAQSEVPTAKPKIKLVFQLADLWVPYGTTCIFYNMPNYNSTTGIWSVAVGNQGKASSPKCSLRIIEQRSEDVDSISGPWKTYKEYWASVPVLAPGEQRYVQVQVAKFTPAKDPDGHPIKHARQWIFKADGKNQVPEVNEANNGLVWKTML